LRFAWKATDQATSKSGVHRNLQLHAPSIESSPASRHRLSSQQYSNLLEYMHQSLSSILVFYKPFMMLAAGGESSLRSTLPVSTPKLQATLRRCESVLYESRRVLLLSLMIQVMITATYELFRCKNIIYTASSMRFGVC
jgi:hypothetical protein